MQDKTKEMFIRAAKEEGEEWFKDIELKLESIQRQVASYKKDYLKNDEVKDKMDLITWTVHYLAQTNFDLSGGVRVVRQLSSHQ